MDGAGKAGIKGPHNPDDFKGIGFILHPGAGEGLLDGSRGSPVVPGGGGSVSVTLTPRFLRS